MKPIVSRELGAVSAAQIRDGKTKGATAAVAAARWRNVRRVNVILGPFGRYEEVQIGRYAPVKL
jgi:hypothetical protein